MDGNGAQSNQEQTVSTSPAKIRTRELDCSPNGRKISDPLKLPSLRAPQHRTATVHLSISEPSLFIPEQRVRSKGFCYHWHPPPQRCPPCHVWEKTDELHQACRPLYTHFSQSLHPLPRSSQVTCPARWPNNSQRVLRPLLMQQRQQHQRNEDLSIRGTPCFRPVSGRKQLHIFLPVEGVAEDDDDRDSLSIDEGFMDGVDHKGGKQPGITKPPAELV